MTYEEYDEWCRTLSLRALTHTLLASLRDEAMHTMRTFSLMNELERRIADESDHQYRDRYWRI